MTGKQFVERMKSIEGMRTILQELENNFRESVQIPERKKLRKATAQDVVVGNVFYYLDGSQDEYWKIVREVRYPDDDFKAYLADDGCRYGLHNAYVEI